ncbi:MAG: bifunctional folylpolyglutamate synthase/dihydrofolate synthase [Treponema sp.]
MSECSSITVLTKWLDQYLNFERLPQKNIFWLDTMQYLCKRFNHPEYFCPSFHVAGSKGKGSISKMIACILERAGYKTGLYSSPHILEFSERIENAKTKLPEKVYEESVKEIMAGVQSIIPEDLPLQRPVTWFELVTLYAMLCFRNYNADYSVYEVGLGGRLDATNVITPKCCCIGPIELEHTEYLGDTVEKIAFEKGGIIKPSIPVIISKQKPSVKKVFKDIAEQRKAPVVFIDDILKSCEYVYKNRQLSNVSYINEKPLYNKGESAFYGNRNKGADDNNFVKASETSKIDGNSFMGTDIGMDIKLEFSKDTELGRSFKRPINATLKLLGEFQMYNAAVACLAVKTVFPNLDESIIEHGLSDAKLPGRFEIVSPVENYPNIPELILDGAHTVNSVNFTMQTFTKLYENPEIVRASRAHLLFACAADKDFEDISAFFENKFDDVMLTRPGETKASNMERLEKAFESKDIKHETCSDYVRAIEMALEKANEGHAPLLVTGSFYLVAEVKKFLLGKKCCC